MKLFKPTMLALLVTLFFACDKGEVITDDSMSELEVKAPTFIDLGDTVRSISINNNSSDASRSTDNLSVALYMAEYITAGDSEETGNTVYFRNVGNKQLAGDFVPGGTIDGTDDISYYVDDNRPSADLAVSASNNAIDRAMSTWDNVSCSDLGMYEIPYNGGPTGFISALFGLGGSFGYNGDVVHCGWHTPLFDAIWGAGNNILGVTFTLVFVDDNGDLVDTDNNGKYDVAFREIYYNDAYNWADNGGHIDVETVALHEAGHGLSQGHFGKAFRNKNGKLHFAPRAVMNASYSGIQTSILKTDNGGHCSNWGQWPNN